MLYGGRKNVAWIYVNAQYAIVEFIIMYYYAKTNKESIFFLVSAQFKQFIIYCTANWFRIEIKLLWHMLLI